MSLRQPLTNMKTFFAIILLVSLCPFLTGCDPAKLLIIKADNSGKSSVTVYTNNKIIPFGNKSDSSKLIIQVPINDTTEKTFSYGIGNWPDNSIAELTTNIDSIIITTIDKRTVLMRKEDIQRYLKKHRGGYAGSVLTIEAK